MKEKIQILFTLLALCLFSGICCQGSFAAERTDIPKTAYVNTAQRGLFLSFAPFSQMGTYRYEIAVRGSVIAEGDAAPTMTYPLPPELYKDNTPYLLVITSGEGDTLSVLYQTGSATNGFRAVQDNNNVKFIFNTKKGASNTGWLAQISQKGSVTPIVESRITSKKSPAIIAGSSLQNGEYEARLIACRKLDGEICYGEGLISELTFVRPPTKVSSLRATPDTKSVILTWAASAGASRYRVLQSSSLTGKYKPIQDNIMQTSTVIKGLKPGKKYYFKVEPVGVFGTKAIKGKQSKAKGASVPVVAGRVSGVKVYVNENGSMYLSWKKAKHAYGYHIYYKKASDPKYTKLGGTTKTRLELQNITENTDYKFAVRAITKKGTKRYFSDLFSKPIMINPVADATKLLANKVRTIGFIGRSREIYTTKKYSSMVKQAFVNSKGKKYSSPTKYLIWISHYTQQVTIFQGTAGNWNIIRSFNVATGRAHTRSPRGIFKIGKKERGWFYSNTKCLYVTHYHGANAFHTRPLYNGGGVATPTLGKPASHGCIRCKNRDAKFIYKSMPRGTTVVSW